MTLSRDLRRPSRHYAGVRDRSLRRRTASPVAACRQAGRGVEGRIGYSGRHINLQRRTTELRVPPVHLDNTCDHVCGDIRQISFWVALSDDRKGASGRAPAAEAGVCCRLSQATFARTRDNGRETVFGGSGVADRSCHVKAGAARHRAMPGCGLDPARPLGAGPVRWPARCAGQCVRQSSCYHRGASR